MTADPFKIRNFEHRPKQPLVLSQSRYDALVLNSKSGQDETEVETSRLEELKQRQEATKALSKLIKQRKEAGSELRKRQYAQDVKNAQLEMERESRIEARRNYVLDQAYKRLYEETDRVKYFNSAKNLSEMLKQRDLQLEAKSKMENLFSKFDKELFLAMVRDIDNYEREEAGKVTKGKEDRKKNAENWTKQIGEIQRKNQQEEWEHLRDGYNIREDSKEYAKEVGRAEKEQKKIAKQYQQMLDKQRKEKLSLLDFYAKLDEADEKRAEIFNESKRNMKLKHKEIKAKLDDKKELKRQHVANNLKDENISRKIKEDEILQKAILQADAKNEQECAIKQAKREEALRSIQEFYEQVMEAKAQKEEEDRRKGYQERRKISEMVEDQQKVEDSKQGDRRNSERKTQHLQLHQMAKKEMDRYTEKVEDIKDYMNHIRSLLDEEEIFQKYANMEIEDCESRGIDTRPMRFAARPGIECGKGPLYKERGYIRPRYYSAKAEGDELNHVKRDTKMPDTKSRLGFMLH